MMEQTSGVAGLLSRATMAGGIAHLTIPVGTQTRHLTVAKASGTQLLVRLVAVFQTKQATPLHHIQGGCGMVR